MQVTRPFPPALTCSFLACSGDCGSFAALFAVDDPRSGKRPEKAPGEPGHTGRFALFGGRVPPDGPRSRGRVARRGQRWLRGMRTRARESGSAGARGSGGWWEGDRAGAQRCHGVVVWPAVVPPERRVVL